MNDVSNALMLEILKSLQSGQNDIKAQLHGIREEIHAMRTHMSATQSDINNLYVGMSDMKRDIERVKTRLNLTDEIQ